MIAFIFGDTGLFRLCLLFILVLLCLFCWLCNGEAGENAGGRVGSMGQKQISSTFHQPEHDVTSHASSILIGMYFCITSRLDPFNNTFISSLTPFLFVLPVPVCTGVCAGSPGFDRVSHQKNVGGV